MNEQKYESILKKIEHIAPYYSPSWRFRRENADMGSALACVFAEQLAESMERFELMPANHRLAFYNRLGGAPLAAVPSQGIVCLCLAETCDEGTFLPKGFKLFSPITDDIGTRFSFETEMDLFAVPAKLDKMIYADNKLDTLSFCDNTEAPYSPGENAICIHKLTFRHEYIDRTDALSKLYLYPKSRRISHWIKLLCDTNTVKWSLLCGEAEYILSAISAGEHLLLTGFPEAADSSAEKQITLEIKKLEMFERLPAPEFILSAEGEDFAPDAVFSNGDECTEPRFYPFGKAYSLNSEVVFLCKRVLCQRGAQITLTLTVGFDIEETDEAIPRIPPRKFIVNKKDIKEPEKPNIFIENTVWEYWNGRGYTRLTLKKPAERIFSGLDKNGDIKEICEYKLEFVCPSDISELLIGAYESFCIRARVKEAANIYKRPARIFIPWIEQVSFRYIAPVSKVVNGTLENNCEIQSLSQQPAFLFYPPQEKSAALYFGFDKPISGGVVRLLVTCCGDSGKAKPPNWYYCTDGGLHAMNVSDKTHSLTQTGTIDFVIEGEFDKCIKYGKEAWWICACFSETPHSFKIDSVLMNAVPVLQCDRITGERFYIDDQDAKIQLKHKNIIDETVYISEAGWNYEEMKTEMEKSQYTIDRANGIIEFKTKPPAGSIISADYGWGGGSGANFNAGELFVPALSAGYISKVYNPIPILGGAERESPDKTITRLGKELRHGNRSVTSDDYEDIISEHGIAAIKSITEKDGKVTVAVLLNEYDSPHVFDDMRRRAEQKLMPLCPVETGLPEIRPPVFVTVKVEAKIRLSCANSSEKVYAVLNDLCDPLVSVKKLGFGVLPDVKTVSDVLNSMPEVMGCSCLFVRLSINGKEPAELSPYALPINGEHSLIFKEA